MNFSAWSIRNPIPAIMLFILLTAMGLVSFQRMTVQNFPDIELPVVTAVVTWPGASPGQMETEVTRKIENAVANLQGLKHIHGRAYDGATSVSVEFDIAKNIDTAVQEVRDAVAGVRSTLPANANDPVVSKVTFSSQPILTFTVSSSRMDEADLSWFVDDTISRTLLGVRGVGKVSRVGGVSREVRVELDYGRMNALGATAADVSRRLAQIQQDGSAGNAELGTSAQTIRLLGTVKTAGELAALPITLSDGRSVRLSDIATVRDTVAPRTMAAYIDGKKAVAFEVSRAKGYGEIDVAARVNAALDGLKKQNPGLELTEAFNFVYPVQENYSASMHLLYEGAILAVLVVWIFLRDWRATFVAAVALPLSIIPAFAGMYFMGFSLNILTLLSLSLVVGILVDDAIVEIENIVRHLGMGKPPLEAAMEAADEIGMAVIATTFTLIAVFLPTAFMGGIPGKFFVQFGWTAAIAIFVSLVVARLITPMMAAYMLRPLKHEMTDGWLMKRYLRAAAWCLKHRVITMMVTAVFFVGSLALAGTLQTGFIPGDDASQSQVSIELPPGSTFAQTEALALRTRDLVQTNPYVTRVYTAIGGGAAGGDPFASQAGDVRKATLTVQLKQRSERGGVRKQAIEKQLRELMHQVPGVRYRVGLADNSSKYQLVLQSENGEQLLAHAQTVEKELRSVPGIGSVTSSASLLRPELLIRPDFNRMAAAGVTSAAVADTVRVATAGDFDQALAKLNVSQRQIPVVVRLPDADRKNLDHIKGLLVPGSGGPVALENFADVSLGSGPQQIERLDRSRRVQFDIELNGQPLGVVSKAVSKLPSVAQLPPGIHQINIGDAEAMAELFASFGLAMLTGVFCIYVVLVLLFKEFFQPATILSALVLSVPGAMLALWLTRSSISMPALIGLIMLMGIATKNSILLVEYAIVARRDHHLSRWDALLDACHKRARPIVMTTIAMGAGMLPVALGIGSDGSFRGPMAIVVIGGLITSTFLSLLVVPVVFTYVDDVIRLLERLVRRRKAPAPSPGH
ncbi:efflux RND transporter permease subunit [Amphibiibacter pelophylacis]|uniref:Efflux RND transporter permease subunit n=1 Tax=Amphibiibacter pelophylacis TaxID=1799477 RepID=A0ACC6P258_9BURK